MADRSPPVHRRRARQVQGLVDRARPSAAIARGLRRVWPGADVRACPMADGGDGTLDAVLSRGGERAMRASPAPAAARAWPRTASSNGPDGRTAVIEVAQIVGIIDPDGMAVPVARRTTRGVGELVRALLDDGVRRFMIGLGGSSTNDGGAGMLAALGVLPFRRARPRMPPTPDGLAALARVDAARARSAARASGNHDHVGRRQPAVRRAGRDGGVRTAEGRARRRRSRARRDARALSRPRRARAGAPLRPESRRWRRRRTGIRAAAARRRVALRRRGGRRSSSVSTLRSPARTGRSPARAAPTRRRCCARRRSSSRSGRARGGSRHAAFGRGRFGRVAGARQASSPDASRCRRGPLTLAECIADAARCSPTARSSSRGCGRRADTPSARPQT